MILTESEYCARRDAGEPFDFDQAQTVASWWYSPGAPALVALATAGKITDGLVEAIDRERELAKGAWCTDPDREDLRLLAEWAREQITPEREARAREELISTLDEMTRKASE